MVANTELTIVGTYINPMYLKAERGDTTIGNGKIEGLITISPDNVLVESYTEIDVTVQEQENCSAMARNMIIRWRRFRMRFLS